MKKEELLNQANCIMDDITRLVEDLKNEHTVRANESAKLANDSLLVVKGLIEEIINKLK